MCVCVCEIEGTIKMCLYVCERNYRLLGQAYFRFAKSQTKLGRMTKSKSG